MVFAIPTAPVLLHVFVVTKHGWISPKFSDHFSPLVYPAGKAMIIPAGQGQL
jgi:hypothetical protein